MTIDPKVELLIEKRFSKMEKQAKDDRHAQVKRLQKTIILQENKFEKAIKDQQTRLEKAIGKMEQENKKLLSEVSGLFARKWVERMLISVGAFIIVGVSTIFWNVFSDKITIYLQNLV